MFDLLSMVRELLKGEFSLDVDKGEARFRGRRIVGMPAEALNGIMDVLYNLLGDGAFVILEKIGETMGKAMRETMGWSSGDEVLKNLPEAAKLAGFGVVKVSGDQLTLENLPVPVDPAIMRYLKGLLRGFCLEPLEISAKGERVTAKVKVVC